MSNGAPNTFLLWSVLSTIFQVFMTQHLWAYDKFSCLRWNSGRQPGAFKRVMTYSYLLTVPLLLTFGVIATAVKYKEGYIAFGNNITPRPFSMWSPETKRWVLPLNFVLAVAWALELVTHLEELTFWIFLLHQGPSKRQWFHSWEFWAWVTGSLCAVIGLPLTAVFTRHQLDVSQAWIFLIGSAAGTTTTILFLYVIARFPRFLGLVKIGGAPIDAVSRLQVFYQLNLYRVVFRFMFTVPLFILAFDSVQGAHRIVHDSFWTDLLFILGLIGCFSSSAITLLIFFPLPSNTVCPYPHMIPPHPQAPRAKSSDSLHSTQDAPRSNAGQTSEDTMWDRGSFHSGEPASEYDGDAVDIADHAIDFSQYHDEVHHDTSHEGPHLGRYRLNHGGSRERHHQTWREFRRDRAMSLPIAMERVGTQLSLRWTEEGGATPWLHPYVMNFTSPIDLLDNGSGEEGST